MNLFLTPREFRLLDGVRLNPKRSFSGKVRGERLTKRKGISIEFADYREYSDGDDLRHLDWNVLARLETPVIRTYQDEEDLALHLLVDVSPSMDFGEPTKFQQALESAAAIGYAALVGGDAVLPRVLGARQKPPSAIRGRVGFPRLCEWLISLTPSESGEPLSSSLRAFAGSSVRPGIAMIVSDGLDPEAPNALRLLSSRGHEVWMLQVLSPIELDPDLEGDVRLVDGEGGSAREITANGFVMKEYQRRLTEHNESLAAAARRSGGRYVQVMAGEPLDKLLKHTFKQEGWLT